MYQDDWPAMVLALWGKTCITFSFGVLFLYGNELIPTEIRTSGTGSASFIGKRGGEKCRRFNFNFVVNLDKTRMITFILFKSK